MKKIMFFVVLFLVCISGATKASTLQKKSLRAGTRSALLKKSIAGFAITTTFMGGCTVCCSCLEAVFEKYKYNDLKLALKISSNIILVAAVPVGILVGSLSANRVYQDSFECYFNSAVDLLEQLKSNVFLKRFSNPEDLLQEGSCYSIAALSTVCVQLQSVLEQIKASYNVLCDIQYDASLSNSDVEDIEFVLHELQMWEDKTVQWLTSAQKYLDIQ